MKEPSSGIPSNQTNYPVNFDSPFNGPDQGGSRVFNPLEELASSRFKVSFEDSSDSYDNGITYYGRWPAGSSGESENADDSEFIKTVQYFQYTDSEGTGYFIMPTDGSQMLLLSAKESLYHLAQVGIYKELGRELTGGTLSFDWYFISDMDTPDHEEYENLASGMVDSWLGNEDLTASYSGIFAYENKNDAFWELDEWPNEEVVTGSSSGWQTQVIHLDQDTTYDSLMLELGVIKDEDWDVDFEDNGDVYLLVDNIQLNGLDEMMQLGQVENALWNNSGWPAAFY